MHPQCGLSARTSAALRLSALGEAQVMLCLTAVVPCLSCWLYPRQRQWDDDGPILPAAESLEPLSHILPCWPNTMQVSAPPAVIALPSVHCSHAPRSTLRQSVRQHDRVLLHRRMTSSSCRGKWLINTTWNRGVALSRGSIGMRTLVRDRYRVR